MYNIFKGQVVPDDDDSTQIIDSNERMEKALERQKEAIEKKLEEYRQKVIEEYLMTLTADEDGKPIIPRDEEGEYILPHDLEGNQLLYVTSDGMLSEEEEIIEEEPEEEDEQEIEEAPPEPEFPPIDREAILAEVNAEADTIRKNAENEAAEIIENAKAEAENMKNQAFEEGRQEGLSSGHAEGLSKATEECEARFAEQSAALQAQVDEQIAALANDRDSMDADYRTKQENLEREMADVFCDIIDKLFGIEFSDKKDILLFLVDNVLKNTPTSKEYLIRINEANYDLINENRQNIINQIGDGITLEIVKDPLLTPQQCQIETESGVYDCGMDVELDNLLKDLRALSLV